MDATQQAIISHFDRLCERLTAYEKKARFPYSLVKNPAPHGIYLHGPVGCGKTTLMDMFYDTCTYPKKCRTHFHSFMRNIHEGLHILRTSAPRNRPFDPIPAVAKTVSSESKLLCFDEFQVTDIADAMILKRLFENLFASGVVMVATSNRKPDDLYKNGLQRVNFIPFIGLLKKQCLILDMVSHIDYRHEMLMAEGGSGPSYYFVYGETPNLDEKLANWFTQLAEEDGHHGPPVSVTMNVYARLVELPCTGNRVMMSSFADLCNKPLGAADYLSLASHFHTVILNQVPELGLSHRTSLKRFTQLIDVLYEKKVRLVIGAHLPIRSLIRHEQRSSSEVLQQHRQLIDDLNLSTKNHAPENISLFSSAEDVFAFERTLSRLEEMCSSHYWCSAGPFRVNPS
ncbi:hypothetical protein CRM22_006148 [Opisthorchis felineus]|nr:hypothetical protein CRM22_006148 [Opisthorchis felineus]